MNKTTFILGMSKDLEESVIQQRKRDLKKIKNYLIRQTFSENYSAEDNPNFSTFKNLTFIQFLYEAGMFESTKSIEEYTLHEKSQAYQQYRDAISASVRGSGSVFLKRKTKDLFTNNFNRKLVEVHKANHDLQIVIDQVVIKNLLKCFLYLCCIIFSMPVLSMLWAILPRMNQE
jgi:hypothetical protein